jgi:integrase
MADLRTHDEVGALALEFAILTVTRAKEAAGARWDEITGDLWTIPGIRMKGGREHRVPLSAPALKILSDLAAVRRDEFIFPGNKVGQHIGVRALLRVLHRMGRDNLTTHGFRSSFTDWAAEQTDFPEEVRNMALAHKVSDKAEAAYRRGDLFAKRRQLADAWARQCDSPSLAEVIPLFRKMGT